MNRPIATIACLCAACLFAACGGRGGETHSHEHHDHAAHSQCNHDHSHDHGHSHAEEDAHDHSEHNHSEHNHSEHSHAEHNHDAHAEHSHENCDHDHAHDHEHNHAEHNHSEHDHAAHAHDHAEHAHGEGIAFTKAQAEAAGLRVETIEELPFYGVIKTSGHIQAPAGSEAIVVAASAGVLHYTDPSIVEGQVVGKDQALAAVSAKKLQDGDPLVKARVAYETALAEYERAQRLVDDKIISAKEFEQTRLRYETAKTTYEGQAQGMTAKGASVTAPMAGYIKQLLVANGSYVEVGQPIAVVTQDRRLQLRAEVSEQCYAQLAKVSAAYFRPSYTDRLYKTAEMNGRLVAYGRAAVEGASHYLPVTFEFDNVGDIIPGTYAEVYLLTTPEEGVVSVPISALTEEQGLYYVYVQVCAEEFMKRAVQTGRRNGERVEILHGLQHGERVVTQGAYQVKLASVTTAIPHGHAH